MSHTTNLDSDLDSNSNSNSNADSDLDSDSDNDIVFSRLRAGRRQAETPGSGLPASTALNPRDIDDEFAELEQFLDTSVLATLNKERRIAAAESANREQTLRDNAERQQAQRQRKPLYLTIFASHQKLMRHPYDVLLVSQYTPILNSAISKITSTNSALARSVLGTRIACDDIAVVERATAWLQKLQFAKPLNCVASLENLVHFLRVLGIRATVCKNISSKSFDSFFRHRQLGTNTDNTKDSATSKRPVVLYDSSVELSLAKLRFLVAILRRQRFSSKLFDVVFPVVLASLVDDRVERLGHTSKAATVLHELLPWFKAAENPKTTSEAAFEAKAAECVYRELTAKCQDARLHSKLARLVLSTSPAWKQRSSCNWDGFKTRLALALFLETPSESESASVTRSAELAPHEVVLVRQKLAEMCENPLTLDKMDFGPELGQDSGQDLGQDFGQDLSQDLRHSLVSPHALMTKILALQCLISQKNAVIFSAFLKILEQTYVPRDLPMDRDDSLVFLECATMLRLVYQDCVQLQSDMDELNELNEFDESDESDELIELDDSGEMDELDEKSAKRVKLEHQTGSGLEL